MAAPRLATAGLARADLKRATAQLVDNLVRMVDVGVVHADLSVYNLLWWDELLWFIDVPQAVDISTNDHALDFLHRDLTNVGTWLRSRGIEFDIEGVFARLVSVALGS
jgi:RIO kinase 1